MNQTYIKYDVCYASAMQIPVFLTERDLFLVVLTFVSCLGLGVEIGLLIGVIANMVFLLYLWARPNINITTSKVRKYRQVTLLRHGFTIMCHRLLPFLFGPL
jgi:MFS superfamily sulfate permease-like transporter